MVFEDIHREEARHVGEPDDASISELTGVAPPCDECDSKPSVGSVRGRHLCEDCHPEETP
jgi:hypothetical protein